jgi:hypothetical protein
MPDVLDPEEITKLLSRIMRGSKRVERSSDDWLDPDRHAGRQGTRRLGRARVSASIATLTWSSTTPPRTPCVFSRSCSRVSARRR